MSGGGATWHCGPVVDAGDWQALDRLMREYAAGLGVDLCFQGFDRELANLADVYAHSHGGAWLAWSGSDAVGCVALRTMGRGEGELKRLYVRESHRGRGIGAALLDAAVTRARSLGLVSVCLDTLPFMHAARRMYAGLGFRTAQPYYDTPVDGTVFMRLSLDDRVPGASP